MSRSERWEVGERPSLDIRVPVGTVEVYVGDAGIVQLTIDAGDADKFEIFKTGDRISVRHPSRWGRGGRNSRVVAYVPACTDVELSSTSGEVRLAGSLGVVRVHTASGDIEVGDATRLTSARHPAISRVATSPARRMSRRSRATARYAEWAAASMQRSHPETFVSTPATVICRSSPPVAMFVSAAAEAVISPCVRSRATFGSGCLRGIRVDAEISTLSGRATLPDPAPAADHVDRRPVRLHLKTVSGDIRVERTLTRRRLLGHGSAFGCLGDLFPARRHRCQHRAIAPVDAERVSGPARASHQATRDVAFTPGRSATS